MRKDASWHPSGEDNAEAAPARAGGAAVPGLSTKSKDGRHAAPHTAAASARGRPGRARRTYLTVSVPFIRVEWPGKLQKNEYGPPLAILATGKLTEVLSPPPISLLWATTRASPALT